MTESQRCHELLNQETWKRVFAKIQRVQHGTLTLIVQDRLVIQMNITEKIRLTHSTTRTSETKMPVGTDRTDQTELSRYLYQRVVRAIQDVHYGQVTLALQNGQVVQLERTEKMRVPVWQGMDGDGI
ncbi:YezD family protein [Heliophilum fasciatum]|uniref:Uncharacterized protein DUF2292 n=1 Tax=Heliophilum fasciatum TaxID=35700 RepID=A0A4R2RM33_9FIRM|nr:YezD family protein [Heliophilum fasciatum]MCW2277675.1 hypothetical protein [Heliophilum fasciatum]TCP65022.1 uncharacterized protein DUF2292 [Heliophilum fasciatum]